MADSPFSITKTHKSLVFVLPRNFTGKHVFEMLYFLELLKPLPWADKSHSAPLWRGSFERIHFSQSVEILPGASFGIVTASTLIWSVYFFSFGLTQAQAWRSTTRVFRGWRGRLLVSASMWISKAAKSICSRGQRRTAAAFSISLWYPCGTRESQACTLLDEGTKKHWKTNRQAGQRVSS